MADSTTTNPTNAGNGTNSTPSQTPLDSVTLDMNGGVVSVRILIGDAQAGQYGFALVNQQSQALETFSGDTSSDPNPNTFNLKTPPSSLDGLMLNWAGGLFPVLDNGGQVGDVSVFVIQGTTMHGPFTNHLTDITTDSIFTHQLRISTV